MLVLLVVSAIDSIRNFPATALFGPSLIFFFIFSAIVFLIPVSLVAAELSAALPDKGGVYYWMARAFGDEIGMLAIWLQWINTIVWYPTILSFIAGTLAYLINPALADSKIYLISVILIVFWGLTLINLFGIEVSVKVNSVCALIGTMFPMVLLILLGLIWVGTGNLSQITFSWETVFPTPTTWSNWVSLTVIIASFLGMELSGVHVNDIRDPQRNFPKAMAYSVFFIIFTMLFGSLAIAIVLPAHEINLVSGVMQLFTNFFGHFHMKWVVPILTILVLVGSVGSIINWLISPAKGLLHAAEYGFLPPIFMRKNRYEVSHNILIAQAILVTIFCLVLLLAPSVNAFYWFFTGLSTDLYVLMYLLMFVSAIKLHYSYVNRPVSFRIPGGTPGMWCTAMVGIFGAVLTIVVSFFPPNDLKIPVVNYAMFMALGNLAMILPVFFFYLYRGRRHKPKHPPHIKDTIKEPKGRP